MLRCSEVTRLHASDDIQRATLGTRVAARVHLLMCRFCRRYVRELATIGIAARDLMQASDAGPDRVEAIIQRALGGPEMTPER